MKHIKSIIVKGSRIYKILNIPYMGFEIPLFGIILTLGFSFLLVLCYPSWNINGLGKQLMEGIKLY